MTTAQKPAAKIDARAELIAAQRKVWGNRAQMCASKGCTREAAPHSCYCHECESEIDTDLASEYSRVASGMHPYWQVR